MFSLNIDLSFFAHLSKDFDNGPLRVGLLQLQHAPALIFQPVTGFCPLLFRLWFRPLRHCFGKRLFNHAHDLFDLPLHQSVRNRPVLAIFSAPSTQSQKKRRTAYARSGTPACRRFVRSVHHFYADTRGASSYLYLHRRLHPHRHQQVRLLPCRSELAASERTEVRGKKPVHP
jgi:hypothetical protein